MMFCNRILIVILWYIIVPNKATIHALAPLDTALVI